MAHEIHAIKENGEWQFRIWSSVVDDYICDPDDEEALKYWELGNVLSDVARSFLEDWPKRVERAKKTGTSSRIKSVVGRNLEKWDEPLPEECCSHCRSYRSSHPDKEDYACRNDKSPFFGVALDKDDGCDFWEES